MLTHEEREHIYVLEKIVPGETLIWQYENGRSKIIAPVFLLNGGELTLRAIRGNRSYSFALHYAQNQLIRRWDSQRHTNPDGTVLTCPHKHYWTKEHGDGYAYEVKDIPKDNVNKALLAFLKECKITIEGNFHPILF